MKMDPPVLLYKIYAVFYNIFAISILNYGRQYGIIIKNYNSFCAASMLRNGGMHMYKTKLCLGTGSEFGFSVTEQIKLFKEAGFDAFFVGWEPGQDLEKIRKTADSENMIFQSVHAPFDKVKYMWEESPETEVCINELIECVRDTGAAGVPIAVMHAFIGFEDHSPNETGLKNFEKVVLEAKKCGVKVAFENTEGEEYLDALMEHFRGFDNVGFCWDTGHEMCYNRSRDMLASYGDRLLCTHLNDNLGIKDFDGNITWIDDLHLLPFDGIADWKNIAERLNKYNYNDILTFELTTKSKPGRHENDIYDKMPLKEYLAEAFKRACRAAALRG